MNGNVPSENPASRLVRRARFAEERRRLSGLKADLATCPHWMHGADLVAALDETLRDIDALEERLEAKAVIAVVGGSGTGKSSLVNALCGCPGTVASGTSRPTTRKAAAVVRSIQDADILLHHFDRDALDVLPLPGTKLPDAILVDAPDTDSTECESYSAVLDRVLENADVLLCVFDATNPKRKDNLDRLARFVAKFQGRHVVLVLNHADLVPADSLERDVVPDFRTELAKSWPGKDFEHVFCTSATQAGKPGAEAGNGLGALVRFLGNVTGRAFSDSRVDRAAFLRESAEEGVRDALRRQGDWQKLAREVRDFEKNVSLRLSERYSAAAERAPSVESADTALLRAVATRWWGPVGFYLGLSRRFRRLVETPFRLSDLFLPIGILRRIKSFASDGKESSGGDAEAKALAEPLLSWADVGDSAITDYASLSERMVRDFGMAPALRDPKSSMAFSELSGALHRAWREAREAEIRQAAGRCSGFFFQLLLNACTFVPAGYLLWTLGSTFLGKNYLPGSFYRQAFVLLALLWVLTSWLVQLRINAAARSIPAGTASRLFKTPHAAGVLPVAAEIDRLASLAMPPEVAPR